MFKYLRLAPYKSYQLIFFFCNQYISNKKNCVRATKEGGRWERISGPGTSLHQKGFDFYCFLLCWQGFNSEAKKNTFEKAIPMLQDCKIKSCERSFNPLNLIQLSRYLPVELLKVADLVNQRSWSCDQRNAYFIYSENILLRVLTNEWKLALRRTLKVRNNKDKDMNCYKSTRKWFHTKVTYNGTIDGDRN